MQPDDIGKVLHDWGLSGFIALVLSIYLPFWIMESKERRKQAAAGARLAVRMHEDHVRNTDRIASLERSVKALTRELSMRRNVSDEEAG